MIIRTLGGADASGHPLEKIGAHKQNNCEYKQIACKINEDRPRAKSMKTGRQETLGNIETCRLKNHKQSVPLTRAAETRLPHLFEKSIRNWIISIELGCGTEISDKGGNFRQSEESRFSLWKYSHESEIPHLSNNRPHRSAIYFHHTSASKSTLEYPARIRVCHQSGNERIAAHKPSAPPVCKPTI